MAEAMQRPRATVRRTSSGKASRVAHRVRRRHARAAGDPASVPLAAAARTPSALDRNGPSALRSVAARHFHENLRAALVAGSKLTAPSLVKALRGAFVLVTRGRRDPFGAALAEARALATVYAAWMETLDPHGNHNELRSVKHLSDAGWIEAQMIVATQAEAETDVREAFLRRGAVDAVDFVVGDGQVVPQRNDLAWLSGFAAGLQGLSASTGAKAQQVS